MKIVDHSVTVKQYPVTYISKEFVHDDKTGKKVPAKHGEYLMRDIEEVHMRRSGHVRWTILTDDGRNIFVSTPEAVEMFGKKGWRHAKRDYQQRLRVAQKEGEELDQYLNHVNLERQRRGQELLHAEQE